MEFGMWSVTGFTENTLDDSVEFVQFLGGFLGIRCLPHKSGFDKVKERLLASMQTLVDMTVLDCGPCAQSWSPSLTVTCLSMIHSFSSTNFIHLLLSTIQ
jgi:hypothetical protein